MAEEEQKKEEVKVPESREEAVTGKAPVGESVETLDPNSREYHVKTGK